METQNNKKLNSVSGGMLFTILMLVFIIFSFLFQSIVGAIIKPTEKAYVYICSLSSPLVLAGMTIFISVKYKEERREIFPIRKFSLMSLLYTALIGGGMLFAFGFINGLIVKLIEAMGLMVSELNIALDTPLDSIISLVVIALLPAITEELFFRGVVINSIKSDNKLSIAFLSAFIFALYHCSATQFVYQFIYGFILAILFMYSKSLIPTMIVHFMNHFLILTFEFFKLNVNLYNILIIIGGLVAVVVPVTLILINLLKGDHAEKKPLKERDSARFIVPFGLFGILFCLVIAISNLFMVA